MYQARQVLLEGVDTPCFVLLHRDLLHHDKLPEEMIVDFGKVVTHPDIDGKRRVSYRRLPSSQDEPKPRYGEVFDE